MNAWKRKVCGVVCALLFCISPVSAFAADVTVGSMGLFSVTLPLEKGNNYICVLSGEQKQEAVVKRVSQVVKSHLKNMIALPGLQETF